MNEDLGPLLDLAGRVGRNPLLAQTDTGNISLKPDGALSIKASGESSPSASGGRSLIPLDLASVRASSGRISIPRTLSDASIETARHGTMPHRVVLHVHSVNTIAWRFAEDAPAQLGSRLQGLRWQWTPYVASGSRLPGKLPEF